MNQNIKEAKQAIRQFIRMHWSDQKLVEVYAFNRDGRMSYRNNCACIRGVTLSDTLHTARCRGTLENHHYLKSHWLNGALATEKAYYDLHFRYYRFKERDLTMNPDMARNRLSAILRAEMRLRSRRAIENAVPSTVEDAFQTVEC